MKFGKVVLNGKKNPRRREPKAEIIYFHCSRQLNILLCITFASSRRPHLLRCSSNKTVKKALGLFMIWSASTQARAYLQLAPSAEYLCLRERPSVCSCIRVCVCEEGGAFWLHNMCWPLPAAECVQSVVFVWYVECSISVCNGRCCVDNTPCAFEEPTIWESVTFLLDSEYSMTMQKEGKKGRRKKLGCKITTMKIFN